MEQSTMADKDLILRVLTMYSDADQRRKEIKNLSKTYTELADRFYQNYVVLKSLLTLRKIT